MLLLVNLIQQIKHVVISLFFCLNKYFFRFYLDSAASRTARSIIRNYEANDGKVVIKKANVKSGYTQPDREVCIILKNAK